MPERLELPADLSEAAIGLGQPATKADVIAAVHSLRRDFEALHRSLLREVLIGMVACLSAGMVALYLLSRLLPH